MGIAVQIRNILTLDYNVRGRLQYNVLQVKN